MFRMRWLVLALFLTACSSVTPMTPTPTATLTPTARATPTRRPSSTPSLFPTGTPPAVLITSGEWTEPYVALTFDVCQTPEEPAGYDAAIVAVLERYDIPATFFMGGDWMRTHPEETKILASHANFELGNHSWSHPDFTQLTADEIVQEIKQTEDLLLELTGRHSRLFRLPFGTYNEDVLRVVAEQGLYTIQWDAVTGDPDPSFDAATLLAEVQRSTRNGSIIIMHANGRGWHSAEALPSIIEYLQSRGFVLVTVSQLLGLEPILAEH
ncbi:MAG: polysaccharide deacetylase family protein [Chloroflexota bacterium]